MSPEALAAIVASIGALIVSIAGLIFTARKTKSEINASEASTADTITTAAGNLIRELKEQFKDEVSKLEFRITQLENDKQTIAKEKLALVQRVDDLEGEIKDLRAWIEKQGLTPPPRRTEAKA